LGTIHFPLLQFVQQSLRSKSHTMHYLLLRITVVRKSCCFFTWHAKNVLL
jgi:hypothetical protein